ncbi:TolC family protein [Pseudomaricurvus alkylphenolicus]|uniref:TolC family protein n=1 Tax=Pseudomaricurvus alkylphenolicus TaxID=1306991 RepID=UPI00141EF577|nr:TolC family protein [Pseudomaricurvus alkylphenolicus]NIB39210.1 TolC family protein [Pseudomaricurvus alkylphenolicus]
MHTNKLLLLLLVTLGSAPFGAVFSDTTGKEPGTLTLERALQQTLQHHPLLQAYPFQQRAAEALRLQAGLRPTPTVSVNLANLAGSGEFTGNEQSEITLTLSQLIELGDKRRRRIQLQDARWQQQQAEYELVRLDILARTGDRYYRVLRLQSLITLNQERIEMLQQAQVVIEQRSRAGAGTEADVARLQLGLAQVEARHQQLDAELGLARNRLSAMWLQSANFTRVAGDLTALPQPPKAQQLLEKLERAPMWMQLTANLRQADARVALANANGQSDIRLGVGLRQHNGPQDQALVVNVSMPLALSNPNRGRIAAAYAERDKTEAVSQLQRQQLRLNLLELRAQLDAHWQRNQVLQRRLLPAASKLLSATEQGYRQGRYSVLQWADAQQQLFSLKREQIDTQHAVFQQFLELERLTGQPMNTAGQGDNP